MELGLGPAQSAPPALTAADLDAFFAGLMPVELRRNAATRRHYGRRLDLTPPARRRRLAVRLVCALQLLFFILFVGTLAYSSQHLTILNDTLDPWWRTLQALGWLGVLGIAVVLADTAATWFARGRP